MTEARAFLYHDGQVHPAQGPALRATERGYLLADGVFETLRTAGRQPFLLAVHLARLRQGAGVLGLIVPVSDEELTRALGTALVRAALPGEAVLRVTLSRGPAAERGLLPGAAGPPTLVIQVTPLAPAPRDRRGQRLIVSTVRRNEGSPLAQLKSLSYLDNVLARREAASAGADDALMLNNRGEVACASAGNIFWTREDGGLPPAAGLITPPCSCGVLPGVTRGVVLALAAEAGIPCLERAVTLPEMLGTAREAFITNSIVGVQPVASLGGAALASDDPASLTRRIARLYAAVLARAAG